MKNENVEIKTNEINIENKVNLDTVVKSEVNLDTVKSVANLTRKDWFAMFYEVFQVLRFGLLSQALYEYLLFLRKDEYDRNELELQYPCLLRNCHEWTLAEHILLVHLLVREN